MLLKNALAHIFHKLDQEVGGLPLHDEIAEKLASSPADAKLEVKKLKTALELVFQTQKLPVPKISAIEIDGLLDQIASSLAQLARHHLTTCTTCQLSEYSLLIFLRLLAVYLFADTKIEIIEIIEMVAPDLGQTTPNKDAQTDQKQALRERLRRIDPAKGFH